MQSRVTFASQCPLPAAPRDSLEDGRLTFPRALKNKKEDCCTHAPPQTPQTESSSVAQGRS